MTQGTPCIINTQSSSPCVARVSSNGALISSSGLNGPSGQTAMAVETHTYIDESYISSIQEDCHWSRDNGIIELIPIAVVEVASYSSGGTEHIRY
jgi:hypothetical protein